MTRAEPQGAVGDVLELAIDAVDDEGRGRGSVAGNSGDLDVAVRGALPGDVVRCQVERVWSAHGIAQARAVSFVREGPLHVERACPHARPCAGCPTHGVDPAFALDWKRARVERALADAGLAVEVAEVEPGRSPRQKVKLVVDSGRVGLYVPHTHLPADATRCAHQHPAITAALAKLAPALVRITPVRAVIARAFVEGVGAVVVSEQALFDHDWAALAKLVDGKPLASLALRVQPVEGSRNSLVGGEAERFVGPQALTPLEGGAPVPVDAFCQPDPELAAHLYRRVARFLVGALDGARLAEATYFDLYAGAGGFARALVEAGAGRVVAVERAAASAITLVPGSGVAPLPMSVEQALPQLVGFAQRGLAGMVADPPKRGLGEVAPALAALGAPRVALVACDPDAGAKDARVFVDAGYRLTAVEPLDLFAGTIEVETLFLLER